MWEEVRPLLESGGLTIADPLSFDVIIPQNFRSFKTIISSLILRPVSNIPSHKKMQVNGTISSHEAVQQAHAALTYKTWSQVQNLIHGEQLHINGTDLDIASVVAVARYDPLVPWNLQVSPVLILNQKRLPTWY
jgi:hypothetical protein